MRLGEICGDTNNHEFKRDFQAFLFSSHIFYAPK